MNEKDLYQMTDAELLAEQQKLKKSRIFYAFAIGFLAAILGFGIISWILSDDKHVGFLIPMLIPVVFIYRMLKRPDKSRELEVLLKERGLV